MQKNTDTELYIVFGKSAMLVGCGCKDEIKYKLHKRATSHYIGHYGYVGSGLYPFNYHTK